MKRAALINKVITAITLLIPVYWVSSEVGYKHRNSPEGMLAIEDFTRRFGTPRLIREIHREGETYYELIGPPPSWPWFFAVPSSPPAYVFDRCGRLVLWCSAPGDATDYTATWSQRATRELSPAELSAAVSRARDAR